MEIEWEIRKIGISYYIFHKNCIGVVQIENETKCDECRKKAPNYILFQRDLLRGK